MDELDEDVSTPATIAARPAARVSFVVVMVIMGSLVGNP
jgi:hypothetical protein